MWGVRAALCAVVVLAGCVHDELVDCGNGVACPARTACALLADAVYCVAPADLEACLDHDPFATCQRADGTTGACYAATPAGVCLPSGCGNGLIDPGEVCDDRNGVVGDGCSANCLSNETCGNGVVDPVVGEQCDDGNLVGHDGCASGCRPEAAQWELVTIGLPTGVFAQGLAYDTARHRMVSFGGAVQNGNGIQVARDETWEWDGVAWTRIATPIAPSARFDHTLAYDPVRRKSVMFGGASSGVPVGADTWEWDGNTWTYLPTAVSPTPRYSAAATWDPERQCIALFGGETGVAVLGDLWQWDGTGWAQAAEALPPPRSGHAMAYDPVRGVMVIAGGRLASGGLGETWERRGGVWTMIAPTPAELTELELAFDGVGLVAFGGRALNLSTGNTWRWDGQAWTDVAPASAVTPPLRSQAGLARDWTTGQLVLLGGHFDSACLSCGSTRTDVWTWDGVAAKWNSVKASTPTGRAFHAATFDALRGVTVVFGGGPSYGSTFATAETWEVQNGHWSQFLGPSPSSRSGPAFAFDAAHGESVLFGGRTNGGPPLADTWLWNGVRWAQQSPATQPAARELAAMAYDPVRRRVVLFSGLGGSQAIDDQGTWEWDGTTWTRIATTIQPQARFRHAAITASMPCSRTARRSFTSSTPSRCRMAIPTPSSMSSRRSMRSPDHGSQPDARDDRALDGARDSELGRGDLRQRR